MTLSEAAAYCGISIRSLSDWRWKLGVPNPTRNRVDMSQADCDALLAMVAARKQATLARRTARKRQPGVYSLTVAAETLGLCFVTVRKYAIQLGLFDAEHWRQHLTEADVQAIGQHYAEVRAARHAASVERNRRQCLERYHAKNHHEHGVFVGRNGQWEREF